LAEATTKPAPAQARCRDAAPAPWWKAIGPGLITGAADDDPSGIATYTNAGAQFGYGIGWTVLLTYPLMVGIQLASARIGRITGKGLTENFARICPTWIVHALVALLVVANVINLGADLNAMGDALALTVHGPAALYTVVFGVVSLSLEVWLPYRRYVAILKWLTLSLLAYVGVAFAVHVDWPAAARGALWPELHWRKDYVTTVVAILGTTISPYLFFWQAAQEVEEIHRVGPDKPLVQAPAQRPRQLRRLRIDTLVGMGFSNLIAFFMIVATAATLHQQGVHEVQTTSQAAEALRPLAGDFAFWLFAAGVIGTGLLAVPVLTGSAAYAVASVLKVRKGLDQPPHKARMFYLILAAAMLVGIVIGTAGVKPIAALYWAAVINAVISVPIMIAVMITASTPKIVGEMRLALGWRLLGWGATAAMGLATIAMFVTALL
jgi:NRAMP (natural resistance-associated macrophage protein)-like metal ion transporter